MSNVTDFPTSPEATIDSLIAGMKGPRRAGHTVIMEGRAIHRLTMLDEGDEVCLILDGRLAINAPREWAWLVANFAASALAIGEGYCHIGAETRDRPFAPRIMELGSDGDAGGGEHG